MNLTELDRSVVAAFTNFLSWNMRPAVPSWVSPRLGMRPAPTDRPCPPAVWAYMLGFTLWCPPKGEM